jgi:phosphate transport system protein
LAHDDIVDDFKDKIFRDVIERLKATPEHLEQGLALILIARNLERIGDHATNIAEDMIFAISGEDIRHSFPGKEEA